MRDKRGSKEVSETQLMSELKKFSRRTCWLKIPSTTESFEPETDICFQEVSRILFLSLFFVIALFSMRVTGAAIKIKPPNITVFHYLHHFTSAKVK